MIGSLRGRLLDRHATEAVCEVLIEVGDVGYRVVTAPTTALALGENGDEVFVWVHQHVREDAETLYGFESRAERAAFEVLLGTHGVGPSLALAILSVHDATALARVVHDDDVAALCLVPGVGKRTAARLLIELKPQLETPEFTSSSPATGGNGQSLDEPATSPSQSSGTVHADVRAALAGLGYAPDEIRGAMAEISDGRAGQGDTATVLRAALTRLAVGAPRSQAPLGRTQRQES